MSTSSGKKPSGKRGSLKTIRSGAISRGFALAKLTASAGARAASHAVGGLFSDGKHKDARMRELLVEQSRALAEELGKLKGGVMKVGQMVSMYGEHFLPPEANALLKSLQSESPPLQWPEIEKVLRRQLGKDRLSRLLVDPEPLASASLGQVHLATVRGDGRKLALKIQYPGVDEAIESDIRTLRSLLAVTQLIPRGPRYDNLFDETREMLMREIDYRQELEATQRFHAWLGGDSRYVVAEPHPEFSAKRVLATTFEPGVPVDSAEVRALSQERRDALAWSAFELYMKELLVFQEMQTDPHFGNYRVRLAESPEAKASGAEQDQLVLLDFGATRKIPGPFLRAYKKMVLGSVLKDAGLLEEGGLAVGLIREEDTPEMRAAFIALCEMIAEPFHVPGGGPYDWGASDLPKRLLKHGRDWALNVKLRSPPRELLFLDRKLTGLFIFFSVLGARFSARERFIQLLCDPEGV